MNYVANTQDQLQKHETHFNHFITLSYFKSTTIKNTYKIEIKLKYPGKNLAHNLN